MTDRLKHSLFDLIIPVVLFATGFKFTHNLHRSLDLGLVDEATYMSQGVYLLQNGLPESVWGPLYSLWYFLLSQWQTDQIDLYYMNHRLLTIGLPILLYIALRRFSVNRLLAAVLSALFVVAQANLLGWPKPAHFALATVLASFIVASFFKQRPAQLAVLAVGALAATYSRPEFFNTFLLLLVWLAWRVARTNGPRRMGSMVTFVAAIALSGLLLITLGLPIGGDSERSLAAFGQHFSLNWIRWNNSNLSNWTDWQQILGNNFGDISSASQALLANPTAFLRHIFSNVVLTPIRSLPLLAPATTLLLPMSSRWLLIERIALLALVIGLFVLTLRLRERHTRPQNRQTWLLFGAYAIMSLITILIIFPRDHYLLLPLVLLIITLAIVIGQSDTQRGMNRWWQLGLFVLAALIITPQYSAKRGLRNRPNLETVRLIRSLDYPTPFELYEVTGARLGYYLGGSNRVVRYTKSDQPDDVALLDYIEQNDIDILIMSDKSRGDLGIDSDAAWEALLADIEALDFSRQEVPQGNGRFLLVRN